MYSLSNKTVIITGSASGIGKATALQIAAAGANVALIDIQDSKQTADEIINNNGSVITFKTDVTDAQQMKEAFSQTAEKWGKIDGVFSNAGMNGKVTPIEDFEPSDWDHTLAVNLKSSFLSTKYAIPYMKETGGSIIITSSINGNRTFSALGMSAYSSSKAGQVAFSKMAAVELRPYNIRVNTICPGAVQTNILDRTYRDEGQLEKITQTGGHNNEGANLDQAVSPDKIANLVLFMLSDESAHITGTEVYIDGTESLS
ncbi:NAD(P)-dependent dehydrogenase (short-subunit alcohol dehydrogenase family) [Salibacterium salarium]|uniref:SDR family oxidoreductase n=1 Tax=Salibacterium salarium TaxID=284579 RepID=UPI00277DD056|nr:SDR family NAD(P)-dependent oxidoreductase [Salibacterium salarium]MDQ0300042.1 NAD(P)-dependent dehydrogenase (short-subunit alcohol dehydrogenase family) [Salibacterium salarium]